MINLTSGQANSVVLTLTEKAANLPANYVLFVFKHGAETVQTAIATSVTTYGGTNSRTYDLVAIPSTTFATLNAYYDYTAYEQSSAVNTDPTDASIVGVLEKGRAKVSGTAQITYIENSNEETYVINQ